MKRAHVGSLLVVISLAAAGWSAAQVADSRTDPGWGSANVLVPQLARCVWTAPGVARQPRGPVQIAQVAAHVEIVEQVATTTLDLTLENTTSSAQEVIMLIPVPRDAVVRSFEFDGPAKEPTARLLPAAEARRTYDEIVAKSRDPGLLEFADLATVRTSIFPIPAQGKQRVRLVYEHVAPRDGNRVDYVLPRTQILASSAVPWKITLRLAARQPIATVYSPSHAIDTQRLGRNRLEVKLAGDATTDPGAFQLSYLIETGDVSASVFAYPNPGGGYFLLLAGLPDQPAIRSSPAMKRELILVLDRSGSMAGEKIEQAKKAAIQIIHSLDDGETFNVIDYSNSIEQFAAQPVVKSQHSAAGAREYITALAAAGGTALHDALVTALRQPHDQGRLPIVLFLTDGLPTVGETNELVIRRAAATHNTAGRRIFTVGVGHDVNVPLLSQVARGSRAAETFIQPREDVEVKVSSLFRKLRGPVLVAPRLTAARPGDAAPGDAARIRDLQPDTLPDLFDGDQLVVLGRYVGAGPMYLTLSGQSGDRERTFRIEADLNRARSRNGFVPRLWAARRIAQLVDEVRQKGAELAAVRGPGNTPATTAPAPAGSSPAAHPTALATHPALKELIDEIVRLSTEFGVLTEYTAFLAREGTVLTEAQLQAATGLSGLSGRSLREQEILLCATELDRCAVQTRWGAHAVSQGVNNLNQRTVACANPRNAWYNAAMDRVETATVQQVGDLSFFRRAGCWIDARALNGPPAVKPHETIELDTPAYAQLADRLTAEGRNSVLGMPGDMLIWVDGRTILVKAVAATSAPAAK
jgi:Ca-activated chloride channel family protein